MTKSESNKALAQALRNAGIKDVRPVWDNAKALRDQGLAYEAIASKLAQVSQPKAQYTADEWPGGTVGGVPKFNAKNRAKVTKAATKQAKQRKPAASAKVKARKAAAKRPRNAQRVSQPTVQYNAAPTDHPVLLVRDGKELRATLKVWPERPKRNGKGVTHTAALVVDGLMEAKTLSTRALTNLLTGVGTWLWYGGEGHLATLAQ